MAKTPFLTREKAEEIAAQFPTPWHIYDERAIRENVRKLRQAFSWNKGYREYFAVKATPNPYIMKILAEEGCGMDCSSYTELLLSDAVGIRSSDIMFSSNATPREDFALAAKLGATINLDDITHIDYVESICGLPSTISCRYNPGGEFRLGNSIMDMPHEAKYGFTREQLSEGFRILKERGVSRFGLHSFLSSNTLGNDYYPTLARILFNTAVELHNETGADIAFINLSGGIGIPYRPEQEPADIMAIGAAVHEAFDEIMVPAGLGDCAIYTELGRYILGPYGALVTRVTHTKDIYKHYLSVDACACNLMRPAMYGAYHHITVLGRENEPCTEMYDVAGSLCENNDKFAVDRMLPKSQIGDLVYIHDTGAHGFSMGYNYNGKLRSAELLLCEDGSVKLIRRAETPADYFATFDFSPYSSLTE